MVGAVGFDAGVPTTTRVYDRVSVPEPAKVNAVPTAIESLSQSIGILEVSVGQLEERLRCVCRSATEKDCCGPSGCPRDPCEPELVSAIDNQADRIRAVNTLLSDILSRIET